MGCGSSQAAKVANVENLLDKNLPNINVNNSDDDGGGGGGGVNEMMDENGTSIMIPIKYREEAWLEVEDMEFDDNKLGNSPGEAFEVPIKPEPDSSLIRKHPPKRLQKLLEDRPQTPHSIEDLEDKLEHAKLRRQQILSQRIENTIKLRENKDKDNNDVIDDDLEEEQQDQKGGGGDGEEGSRVKTTAVENDTNIDSNNLNEEVLRKNQLNAN